MVELRKIIETGRLIGVAVSRLVGLSYFGGGGETTIHGTEDVSELK